MDCKEMWFEGLDRIHLSQDSLVVGSCKHGNERLDIIKSGNFNSLSLSRKTRLAWKTGITSKTELNSKYLSLHLNTSP
jgi:hypothetical protein